MPWPAGCGGWAPGWGRRADKTGARMGRLIVISNRVALPTGARAPGGLAVGVHDALRDSGGTWLGWNGEIGGAGADAPLSTMMRDNVTYATFPLAQHEDRKSTRLNSSH